jgi:hypothetical protein
MIELRSVVCLLYEGREELRAVVDCLHLDEKTTIAGCCNGLSSFL